MISHMCRGIPMRSPGHIMRRFLQSGAYFHRLRYASAAGVPLNHSEQGRAIFYPCSHTWKRSATLSIGPCWLRDFSSSSRLSGEQLGSHSFLSLDTLLDQDRCKSSSLSDLTLLTSELVDTYYKQLRENHSWLQEKRQISYIQLNQEGVLEQKGRVITHHPSFDIIRQRILDSISELTLLQTIQFVKDLRYLGIPPDDSLIGRLLAEMNQRLPHTDRLSDEELTGLCHVSHLMNSRFNNIINKTIFESHKELLSLPSEEFTSSKLQILCEVSKSIDSLMSHSRASQTLSKLHDILTSRPEVIRDPATLEIVLFYVEDKPAYLQRVRLSMINKRMYFVKDIFALAAAEAYDLVPQFKPNNIAAISSSLKRNGKLNNELAQKMETHALSLINKNSRISDISNVLFATSSKTPDKMKIPVMTHLQNKLEQEQLDSIVLSNLFETLQYLFLPKDLMFLLHKQLPRQINNLSSSRRLTVAHHFLQKKKLKSGDVERKIVKELQALLGNNQSTLRKKFYWKWGEVTILAMLIKTLNHVHKVTEDLSEEIEASIAKLNLEKVQALLNSVTPQLDSFRHQEQTNFHSLLSSKVSNSIDDNLSMADMCLLGLSLCRVKKMENAPKVEQVIKQLSKFDTVDDPSTLPKITRLLDTFRYFDPDVLENMANFVTGRYRDLPSTTSINVLSCLGLFRYSPQRCEDFTDAMLDIYSHCKENLEIMKMIEILYNLLLIGEVPESELNDFFSEEILQEIDTFLEDISANRGEVVNIERKLMHLNRSVVLNCPDINIPWFNEEFALSQRKTKSERKPEFVQMKREIREFISDAVGGDAFYRSSQLSAFGHKIDFIIGLDSSNEPITFEQSQEEWDDKAEERIAVIVLGDEHFCANTGDLLGHACLEKSELERIGYRVVTISLRKWNSEGVSTPQDRMAYVENSLFPVS